MTDEERAELLRNMYQDDDGDAGSDTKPGLPPQRERSRSQMIFVNGKWVEVPTMGYLARLEHLVVEQGKAIRRLEQSLVETRSFVRRQTGTISEISRELAHKIDYRDNS